VVPSIQYVPEGARLKKTDVRYYKKAEKPAAERVVKILESLGLHAVLSPLDQRPTWSCPDLADRFDCLDHVDALVSNSMGDT